MKRLLQLVCMGFLMSAPALAEVQTLEMIADPKEAPSSLTEDEILTVQNSAAAFELDLYKAASAGGGNLALSPESLHEALFMAFAGARGNTASEIEGVLHGRLPAARLHEGLKQRIAARSTLDAQVTLNVANSFWVEKQFPLDPAFTELLKASYRAEPHSTGFSENADAARAEINRWVAENTQGMIAELLPPTAISRMTRLVLVNAVYLKAAWQTAFDKARTQDGMFRLNASQSVTVPMMQGRFREVGYYENDDFQALALPYAGGRMEMVFFLPRTIAQFGPTEDALNGAQLRELWDKMKADREVDVTLPRFTASSHMSMREVLTRMGMRDAFDEDKADFSGMTGGKELFVSDVIHQAKLEVNEEGTEAAAATAIIMSKRSMAMDVAPMAVFEADRPFLYLLRDRETNAIWFIGRVLNPLG